MFELVVKIVMEKFLFGVKVVDTALTESKQERTIISFTMDYALFSSLLFMILGQNHPLELLEYQEVSMDNFKVILGTRFYKRKRHFKEFYFFLFGF